MRSIHLGWRLEPETVATNDSLRPKTSLYPNERSEMDPEKVERITRLRKRAKLLRKNPTPGEAAFWDMVRKRRFYGHRFRRQVVIDPYIVDFCSHELQLIVEIDGPSHSGRWVADTSRSRNLRRAGFAIFHFSDAVVHKRADKVWSILKAWRGRDES